MVSDAMLGRPLRIFVVENHEDTLFYLANYLKIRGHEIQTASSVGSALQLLAYTEVDVLISDIGLSDGDGWQLMRRVGEMKGRIPFGIAMSGYNTPDDIERSRQAGYHHYLVKPFLPEELDIVIEKAAVWAEKS